MKMIKVLSVLMMVLLMGATLSQAADITAPGDTVKEMPNVNNWGTNGDGWPTGEAGQYCIDNKTDTKYLHRVANYAAVGGSGIRVAPALKGRVIIGVTFSSANDSAGRDPRTFILRGSNTSIDGPFTDIATGTVNDFIQTAEWPRQRKISAPIVFSNTVAYDYYELMIPTLRSNTSTLMQISEFELLDNYPTVNAGVDRVVRLPNTTLTLSPTITDLDSTAFTYVWTQVSGPGAVDFGGTQNTMNATVTLPATDGLYELKLEATDESNHVSSDNVIVRVWDPALSNKLLAHWKFNEGTGMIANDSTVVNDKGALGKYNASSLDPNWVTGWIPADGANNFALNFRKQSYVEVIPEPNDPTLLSPVWSITISAWMNPLDWDGNRRIMQKGGGDNQYRVLAEWGEFKFHLFNVGTITGPLPKVKQWHHVAATYDGTTMRLYIDGLETKSLAAVGPIGVTTDSLFIGTKGKTVSFEGDYFKGALEDLRLYNYALSPEELKQVVKEGQNAPPVVSIVQPVDVVMSVRDYIDMDATVFDVNNNTINYKWTASDASVTFSSDAVEDPRVTFTAPGTFTLRLAVNDGYYGLAGDIYAEVTVKVTNPNCADAILAGKLLEADMNQDCRVDLLDLALIIQNWLTCNDPSISKCINPYASPAVQ